MTRQIHDFLEKLYDKFSPWLIIGLIITIIAMGICSNHAIDEKQDRIDEFEYIDTLDTYHQYYYEKKYKELKKTNKELYDSLKAYKDKINYIVQFTHEKDYESGIVQVKPNDISKDTIMTPRTFEYESEPNDTFQYNLKINSLTEPNWYSIKAHMRNKFTIVNKEEGGMNHVTIDTENGGKITNPTIYKKQEKRKFLDRVSIGPSVTYGYDMINHQWGLMIGASVTINLRK